MSQDYNSTLNLPKTDFPMRAGLPKSEPVTLQNWEDEKEMRASPCSFFMTALLMQTVIFTSVMLSIRFLKTLS